MSRRGPKIAKVHPAFMFPCRKCRTPVIHVMETKDEDDYNTPYKVEGTECQKCHHKYPASEIELAHAIGIVEPCNSFDCPYCRVSGIIINDEIHKTSGNSPLFEDGSYDIPGLNDFQPKQQTIIGLVSHEAYQWNLPKILICCNCDKPVRLASEGCIYIRSLPLRAPIVNPRPETKSQRFLLPDEIGLTPKMKAF
jgi:hypothetical protein